MAHTRRNRARLGCLGIVFILLATPVQAQRRTTTPLQRATELKQNQATATTVAQELQRTYRQREEQITGILHQTGYPPAEVAQAMVQDLRVSGGQVTQYMVQAGYAAPEVLVAMLEAGQLANTVIASFRRVSLQAQQSAEALQATGASAEEAAQTLKEAGYSPEEVAAALESTYGLPPGALVLTMQAVNYAVPDILEGLKNVGASRQEALQAMKDAGYTQEAVMPDAIVVFNLTVEQTVEILQQVYALNLTQAMLTAQLFYDLSASAIVTALRNMGSSFITVAAVLDAVGFTLQEILDALVAAGCNRADDLAEVLVARNASLQEAVQEMNRLNVALDDIGEALVDEYGVAALPLATALFAAGLTAQEAALVLQGAGFTALVIAQAMGQAGYTVDAIGAGLAVAGFVLDATAEALKQAGHGVVAVAEALDDAFPNHAYSEKAQALKNARYSDTDNARAQKDAWNRNAGQGASLMHGLGYGAETNARAQKDVWNQSAKQGASNMGDDYTARQHAAAQRNVWNQSSNQTAVTLKDELGYSASTNADALKDAYNAGDAAVAGSLNHAGYSYNQIQQALVDVFNMTVAGAVALLTQLGIHG